MLKINMDYSLVQSMQSGNTLTGFYLTIGGVEIFAASDWKRPCKGFAEKLLKKLDLPDNPGTISEVLYYTVPAVCNLVFSEKWNKWYFNISGKNFSGRGSDDLNDGKTLVLSVNKKDPHNYLQAISEKVKNAYIAACEAVKAGTITQVFISHDNDKTHMDSLSLLPGITCPGRCNGTCGIDCYAAKLMAFRDGMLNRAAENTAFYRFNPEEYWRQASFAISLVKWFRFNVSGDFPDYEYFCKSVEAAKENPDTQILAFTKQWEIVNRYFDENGGREAIPSNYHILFSGGWNLKPVNPYHFPETTVYNDGEEIPEEWLLCGGNCLECGCRGCGCWKAAEGETIAFKKH